ncbi:Electron transport complex protein rnfC [Caldithrix abyssi DSM 13497]|uniref:Ion-translocating oxidoreductase complex subunit C n=1 Tax=Caldithrix abyssi DSM 13497 TaxID=880073 RepID=H1XPQ4_CALAY|nr:electron transport complex subunit RsxC [Caldithrix abyssi]APF19878.1 electron transport complex protein RnfC [Caldithrix abyssi DSM 13497]EHO39975.1 Electron transport complex protein rnfC [Caldithrix abyssi DSM 13497]
MLQLKTFPKGGIHPPHQKHSAQSPIIFGEIPETLLIPVNQHIGRPLTVVVKKGDSVKRGDLLAKSTGFISSNVHAPVNGKVLKVFRFPLLGGAIGEVIQIKPDEAGKNYAEVLAADSQLTPNFETITADEIRKKIEEAGIIGMGGAGFPTHVKLSPPPEKKIDALIINGAECEPYITADHRVMVEKAAEIVQGIKILQKLFNDITVYIGIEENKPDALQIMDQAVAQVGGIFVVPLKAKYPQGGEKQLIKAVLNREVPSKGLPMDVGVVVQNVATVLAIRDVFYHNRPLMERVVTISGNVVENPGNILLPIGTPVSYIVQKFNIATDRVRLLISGGPMMGRTCHSFESPIGKTTSALLFFDDSAFVERVEDPCLRCSSCISVCPMGLDVAIYAQMIRANKIEEYVKAHIMDCIECGSCTYVCPANRRLVHWMRLGKRIIKREN